MRKSLVIKYFLLMFAVGVAIRSYANLTWLAPVTAAIVGGAAAAAVSGSRLQRKQITSQLLLGGLFFCLGWLRVEMFLPELTNQHIINYQGHIAVFTGQISQEPDHRIDSVRYQVDVAGIDGDVLVFGPLFPVYVYGDELHIQCRLDQPEKINGFDYPGFLAKDGIYALCFNPQEIKLLSNSHPELDSGSRFRSKFGMTVLKSWLIEQKQEFKSVVDQTVNYPASTFLNSIMLGLRREVPASMQENFSVTGTSHLMAISGLHIVMLTAIIFSLFRFVRISKKTAAIFVIIFLIFFIGLIGFKASAMRAGLFGLVGILSFVVGRPKRAVLVLLWAASILLLINPLLLAHDIGFQLSFLAVLGLIYLGPWFKKIFKHISNTLGLRDILVMTMSAQIFVLPWILYKFGTLSFIAPVANLLVLPVMPLIMALGFILLILGLIWLPLAQILGSVLWILISYILAILEFLAGLPLASWQTSLPFWGALLMYLLLALFIYRPARRFILAKTVYKLKKHEKVLTADAVEVVTEIIFLPNSKQIEDEY